MRLTKKDPVLQGKANAIADDQDLRGVELTDVFIPLPFVVDFYGTELVLQGLNLSNVADIQHLGFVPKNMPTIAPQKGGLPYSAHFNLVHRQQP